MSTYDERLPYAVAQKFIGPAVMKLGPAAPMVMVCGSLRRGADTIGDLDVVVATDKPLTQLGLDLDYVKSRRAGGWIQQGPHRMMLDVFRSPYDSLGAFALFLTGPADMNVAMRQVAKRQGVMLTQYGVFEREARPTPKHPGRVRPGRRLDLTEHHPISWHDQEKLVFETIGWPWIEPQERDEWRSHVRGRTQ